MTIYAKKVRFLQDVTIEVTFQDGKIITYDMSRLFKKYPQLEELRRDRQLFESGHLDPGGFGIVWNDELDIEAWGIYQDGEVVGQEEPTINQKLGILLAKTREELNITQTQLAKLTNIDQGDISKIEKGIGNPTLSKINKLFSALGKTISINLL